MDKLTPHICQSPEWGEFKTKMGTEAVRVGETQLTTHRLPKTPLAVGYCPRPEPEKIDWAALYRAGREHHCVFIKIEPNALRDSYQLPAISYQLLPSRPIFARQTILLDLKPEEDLILAKMHPKTRYNLHLAPRKGVGVRISDQAEDLEAFIRLQKDTAARQGFYVHPDNYYRSVFQTLHPKGMAYLLIAQLPACAGRPSTNSQLPTVIAAWLLFRYGGTLYYPYGGSDYRYRNLMASSLLMWEAIKLGRRLGCTVFDMWGACDDPTDPWYGFTRFKLGFGGELISFAPTMDLVINPFLYPLLTAADRWRWLILKALRKGQAR